MKRVLLLLSLMSATVGLYGQSRPRVHETRAKQKPFNVVEATIPEMQAAMKQGRVTSRDWVAGGPTPMPGGYNALVGFSMNPYDPRRDPRDSTFDGRPALPTGGSSSGVGTTANFWAANVGTETSGSILNPANQTMLAAIKPTVGRISRYGIIPITADQDTAGPLARTVTDAAILLGALESAAPDPNHPATQKCA